MSSRHNSAPRKRPSQPSTVLARLGANGAGDTAGDEAKALAEDSADGQGVDELAIREQFISDFGAFLREEPGIDQEELGYVMQVFRQAVMDAPLGSGLTPARPEDFTSALDAMTAAGLIDSSSRISAERQIREAFAPLETEEVQIALEYARRIHSDGEEAALEWLQERKNQLAASGESDGVVPARAAPRLAHSVTQGRARKPRGPPRQ